MQMHTKRLRRKYRSDDETQAQESKSDGRNQCLEAVLTAKRNSVSGSPAHFSPPFGLLSAGQMVQDIGSWGHFSRSAFQKLRRQDCCTARIFAFSALIRFLRQTPANNPSAHQRTSVKPKLPLSSPRPWSLNDCGRSPVTPALCTRPSQALHI